LGNVQLAGVAGPEELAGRYLFSFSHLLFGEEGRKEGRKERKKERKRKKERRKERKKKKERKKERISSF
jgi:hypothetical protein